MGLSSKDFSDDHETDRSKNSGNLELPKPKRQQQSEIMKCPRCESTNTKFCYYNNCNKTQPRHFCKECKRHWTNGGTLRNIPVGGGRKNKRLKRPNPATTTSTSSSTISCQNNFPRRPSDIKEQARKPFGTLNFSIDMPVGLNDPTWDINGCNFMNSTIEEPQNSSIGFASSSTLSSFDPIPTSVPFTLSTLNCNEGDEKLETLETREEDSTITSIFPRFESSTIVSQPWEGTSTTNSFIDLPNYWNWNIDVEAMVLSDMNIPWDDSEFNIP